MLPAIPLKQIVDGRLVFGQDSVGGYGLHAVVQHQFKQFSRPSAEKDGGGDDIGVDDDAHPISPMRGLP